MALQEFIDQTVPGPQRDYVGYGRHIPKVRWPKMPESPSTSFTSTTKKKAQKIHPPGR